VKEVKGKEDRVVLTKDQEKSLQIIL